MYLHARRKNQLELIDKKVESETAPTVLHYMKKIDVLSNFQHTEDDFVSKKGHLKLFLKHEL